MSESSKTLIGIAVMITVVVWIALMVVRTDHDINHLSPSQQACFDQELHNALMEMRPMNDALCVPSMPAYAAHPFWYALTVGVVVLIIGRIAVFIVRMERTRGY